MTEIVYLMGVGRMTWRWCGEGQAGGQGGGQGGGQAGRVWRDGRDSYDTDQRPLTVPAPARRRPVGAGAPRREGRGGHAGETWVKWRVIMGEGCERGRESPESLQCAHDISPCQPPISSCSTSSLALWPIS